MKHEGYWNAPAIFGSDRTRFHALELHIVRSVAERHGARVETDSETNTIRVSFRETQGDGCLELENQLHGMYQHVSILIAPLAMGKMPICIMRN